MASNMCGDHTLVTSFGAGETMHPQSFAPTFARARNRDYVNPPYNTVRCTSCCPDCICLPRLRATRLVTARDALTSSTQFKSGVLSSNRLLVGVSVLSPDMNSRCRMAQLRLS